MRAARPAAFVGCSESAATARYITLFEPAIVVRRLGGVLALDDPSAIDALAGAIDRGVRDLVLCAHGRCSVGPWGSMPSDVFALCLRELLGGPLAARLRAHDVALHTLWLDDSTTKEVDHVDAARRHRHGE